MKLHTCLWNAVAAFDFKPEDFEPLRQALPQLELTIHESAETFLAVASEAEYLLTWEFPEAWYDACPNLKAIYTPAAGDDWVVPDPRGKVQLVHGTFHGPILAESLLSAMLFMNHKMPAMLANHARREWDRDLQQDCRLLHEQTVLIIGLGHIGTACARLLRQTGARVIGIKRDTGKQYGDTQGIEVRGPGELDRSLAEADHVALLLPANADTDRYLDAGRIMKCKPGVYLYNFGRGNALASADVIATADYIGGAFLDVVDEEPLPASSPLWQLPNVMITPHSSCVYREYKSRFVDEVAASLQSVTSTR